MISTLTKKDGMGPPPVSVLGLTIADLSPQQLKALEEIREEFKNEDYPERDKTGALFALDDYIFVKFLRARDYDVKKASKILHQHLDFRRKMRLEEITLETPGVTMLAQLMGKNNKGFPVLTYALEFYEPRRYTSDSFFASRSMEIECARRLLAREGWKVDQVAFLVDINGFRLLSHTSPHCMYLNKLALDLVQVLYRDTMACCYIVDAPLIFQKFFNIVKGWMKEATAKKVMFVSSEQLKQHFSPENLYQQYGGLVANPVPNPEPFYKN